MKSLRVEHIWPIGLFSTIFLLSFKIAGIFSFGDIFSSIPQERLISVLGLLTIIAACWAVSENKQKVDWRLVGIGLIIQFALALFTLKTSIGKEIFSFANTVFTSIISFTDQGTAFVFGSFMDEKNGFVFALRVLPVIVFMGGLLSVLYYTRIMNGIVEVFSWVMRKILGTSGSESTACVANMFFGPTESSLVVKPFVKGMTRSEIFCLVVGGLSSVAGSVLASFVGIGIDITHLLTAVVLSSVSALVVSKIIIPETEESETFGTCKIEPEQNANSVIEAFTNGAMEGLKLAITIAGLLIAFIAAIALVNGLLGKIGPYIGVSALSLELIMGYVFAPIAWLQGIPSEDIFKAGSLLGKKLVANEFIAYIDLVKMQNELNPRTVNILIYGLCGFTNMSAYAILLGSISQIAPEKKTVMSKFVFKALFGGTCACLITGCIAGILL